MPLNLERALPGRPANMSGDIIVDHSACHRETGETVPVSIPATYWQEQLNWLRDFAVGTALAAGAGLAFALIISLGHVAWAAVL